MPLRKFMSQFWFHVVNWSAQISILISTFTVFQGFNSWELHYT